ncbi:uncharacterized protein LACBIDRAFT_308269 [Laccaria bicolor S238N-H82]|uniref:Predicted protein n=1 Tax=Laccaria bicolor (strain S238N-H82 / ATCC MYA-4686) TaxID=486041 RepID=B0DRZ1_LACBS|nr:uncharacterized protein LACBIDRAFT_308269 [Laccaria bicolor S238N-H82]EDR02697.1 predicted protein [Laccaria bicolor S238N-H82]|eukprot:XP_001886741.1 predicted protein [Laccaria bicolor S238N-H82]
MLLHLRVHLCALFLALSPLASLAAPPSYDHPSQTVLSQAALSDILFRGLPILGPDNGCSKTLKTCDWMAKIPDNTPLVRMNLPGTHDTSTWNYSATTQASLTGYTGPLPPAYLFRCQERSLLQSLNDGIRVFDLRFAYNPGNDTIGFYHSLLAPTTTMTDIFFGLYQWLNKHPTEAVLVSINHESGTGTPYDAKIQEMVYDVINSDIGNTYWGQTSGSLGTLGQARGKLTLLQRFTFDLLPAYKTKRIGIQLDPGHWTDNGKAIELVYNADKGLTAFIEDYYDSSLPLTSTPSQFIEEKFGATTAHLGNATLFNPDQLYISFVSAAAIVTGVVKVDMTPRVGCGFSLLALVFFCFCLGFVVLLPARCFSLSWFFFPPSFLSPSFP